MMYINIIYIIILHAVKYCYLTGLGRWVEVALVSPRGPDSVKAIRGPRKEDILL